MTGSNGHTNGNGSNGSGPSYKGRLELTWTNKDLCLLAREDGSYEWLPPSDYRVAEVRLLHDDTTVGEVASAENRAQDNLVICGDALNGLRSLAELPEFARRVAGKVKLAYLDPPFNTQQSFLHYDDALEHSVWLTMMRDRLRQVRDLLAEDGSVWVHCDDSEQAHLKVMMDELFGRSNFIGTVVWEKADTLRNDAKRFSVSHDFLLVYAKDADHWEINRLPRTEEMDSVYKNPDDDERGPWLPASLISPHYRKSGDFVIVSPSGREHRAPEGTSWRVPEETYDALLDEDRIWFGKAGDGVPQRKRFLTEVGDRVPDTVWSVKEVGGNRQSKNEIKALFPDTAAFDTPKPERLLERVLQLGSEPGDLVLDCFLGSGTTAAVAQKMGRRWIGIERNKASVQSFTIPRLSKVVAGEDQGGISKTHNWKGGGSFRVLQVAPSMFEDADGIVLLADWATNGGLSQATAAQLGFEHQIEPPFSGRKGRQRLAVIDGMVSRDVIDLILHGLGEAETVMVCGTALDDEAGEHLRGSVPGSRARKIPASLLAQYRYAARPDGEQLGQPR